MTIEGEREPIPVSGSLGAAVLRDHPLFSGIDERELECVMGSAETRRFDTGEALFRRGDPGDSVVLVLSGRVAVGTRRAGGETVVMNVLEAGELVGEMAVLEGTVRSADVTAVEPSEALIIPNSEFLGLLVGHPGLAVRMLGTLTERLRSLSERLGAEPEPVRAGAAPAEQARDEAVDPGLRGQPLEDADGARVVHRDAQRLLRAVQQVVDFLRDLLGRESAHRGVAGPSDAHALAGGGEAGARDDPRDDL